jgi:hypothetical protein
VVVTSFGARIKLVDSLAEGAYIKHSTYIKVLSHYKQDLCNRRLASVEL